MLVVNWRLLSHWTYVNRRPGQSIISCVFPLPRTLTSHLKHVMIFPNREITKLTGHTGP